MSVVKQACVFFTFVLWVAFADEMSIDEMVSFINSQNGGLWTATN